MIEVLRSKITSQLWDLTANLPQTPQSPEVSPYGVHTPQPSMEVASTHQL